MAGLNEEARIPVYINDEQAKSALKTLQAETEKWRKKMYDAMAGGDLKGMKEAEREIKKVTKQTAELKREAFDVNKVLSNLSSASTKDMRKAIQLLNRDMEGLNRNTKEYTDKQKQVALLKAELYGVNNSLRSQQSLLSRSAAGMNKYFTLITAGVATLTGIVFSVKEFVKGMVGLDDSLANVMKTTGLARTEVREMYQDFKTFNTRTPRKELLELAEEAGRLGKKSRKDVMDFVEVANQIKVALGDDLGGEASVAIREVGKLTEIYKISAQYGTDFKESMLKVGSAINEVSANSNAQAPYLIDYLKRLGGIAGQMKISAAETIGYASTLDQLGQSQEMAATAQGKLMVDMFKDQAKYAAIAKMSTADFAKLLNTDANEAFLKLLEGLNGNNDGFSVMAEKLDKMGLDGARAVQVLAVLSANTKIVREQQALANDAMDKGISLTNEYNIKNNNLAGSVEKIGQFLHSKFINSSFLGWMEKVVAKVSEWTEVKLYDTLRKEQTELNLLVNSITNANNTNETRKTLLEELQKKYPDFLKNLDTEKLTNEQLAARLKEVNTEYENKILLAIKEDSLTDNYKQRLQLKLDELKAIKDLAYYEEIAGKARAKIPQGSDANAYRAVLSTEEIQALQNVELIPKKLQGIRNQFAELQKEESELNAAISGLQSKVTNLNGGSPGGSEGGTPDGSPGENYVTPLSDEEKKKTESLTDRARKALIPAQENEIPDIVSAQMMRDEKEWADKKAKEKEWTAFLKKQIDERVAADAKFFGIEKEVAQARIELKDFQIDAIGQLATAFAGMAEQGSAAQIALIATEKAVAIAQIWINYARESAAINATAAAMGPLGIAYGAAMNAKALAMAGINTGIVVAQTVASAVSSKKRQKTPGYFGGGFANEEQYIVAEKDKPEWIAPNWMVQDPKGRQIIDILEIARRNGSLARLDLRQIVQAIPANGMAAGGWSSNDSRASDPGTSNQYQVTATTDPEIKQLIAANTAAINHLLTHGVQSNISMYNSSNTGIKQMMEKADDFENLINP